MQSNLQKVSTYTSRLTISKKSTNNKCCRGCGEKGTLLYCWWECKLVQPLWRRVWRILKKLKIELPYDPGILLLGMYPQNNVLWKDTCTPMFTVALYTIAKTWKQPKCPLTEEWIKKMWYIYIYTREYHSAIKTSEILPLAATWMDLEIITLSEVSQTEKNIIWYHLYVESKKWYKWTYLQNRNISTDIETKLMVTKGDRGRKKLGIWD